MQHYIVYCFKVAGRRLTNMTMKINTCRVEDCEGEEHEEPQDTKNLRNVLQWVASSLILNVFK